jgi:hypothetical protein
MANLDLKSRIKTPTPAQIHRHRHLLRPGCEEARRAATLRGRRAAAPGRLRGGGGGEKPRGRQPPAPSPEMLPRRRSPAHGSGERKERGWRRKWWSEWGGAGVVVFLNARLAVFHDHRPWRGRRSLSHAMVVAFQMEIQACQLQLCVFP